MALGLRPLHARRRVEDGFGRPADGSRLFPPDRLRLVLGFAEPSGRACFMQDLLLALERELVPLHRVLFGISPCVADHLAVALGKGRNRAFGDIESNDGLAIGVEPDPDAERPQAVGKPRLEERAVFMDLVGGQRLGIDRADPSIVGDHEVRDEIVQMIVGIAGDRRVHQIGRPLRPVLDGKGRPGGVMREGHPADLAALGAFLARMPLPRDAFADDNGGGVETVVVTAERVEENLQKVPVAVTAFTTEQLRVNRINSLDDVAQRTPNFTMTEYNQAEPEFFIRGIGTDIGIAGNAGGDPSVVMMLDGAYLSRGGANLELYDLERVEVLRGPQGTLFGKNALGGVIQLVTRKPTDDFYYEGSATYGAYNTIEGRGLVNGQVANDLDATLSVAYTHHNGYTFNETTDHHDDDDNNLGARLSLRYRPTQDIDWIVTADWTHVHANGDIRHNNCDPTFAGGVHCVGINPSPRITDSTIDGFLHRDVWGLTSNLDWKTDYGTLTSVTAYRNSRYDHLDSFFSNPINPPNEIELINEVAEAARDFSQELRFAFGDPDGRVNGQTGAYYLNEYVNQDYLLNQIFFVPALTGRVHFPQTVNTTSAALFAQGNLKIFDNLTLTLGARMTWETKHAHLAAVLDAGPGSPPPLDAPYDVHAHDSWNAFTPHMGLNYQVTDNAMTYLTASRGFKSGGYQGDAGTGASAAIAFNPEYAWSYEAGAKTQWFDNRLRLNLAIFRTFHKDLQVSQLVPFCCIVVGNAARAREDGVELEAVAEPIDGFTVNASYAYLKAKYTSFATGATSNDTGNYLTRAPSNKYNIGAQYTFPINGSDQALIRGDYTYQTKMFYDPTNDPTTEQKGYGLFDARASVTFDDGRLEAALWGKNLSNALVTNNIVAVDFFGQQLVTYLPPRTFGVTLTYHS